MPLLDLFWTMIWFFLFVAWIWLLYVIVTDLYRSRDLSGWAKALWVLFIIFLPVLGTFIYLIVRGGEMAERSEQAEMERDQMRHDYIKTLSGRSVSAADEIDKLARLRDSGAITEEEFQGQKAKLLAQA
jgi:hypothetical protein